MKKIVSVLMVVLIVIFTSCKKKLTDMNTDTKNPSEVTSASLFSNAQKTLVTQVVSPSVNQNVLRLFAQYWAETTYYNESRYDILTRKIADNEYLAIYRDVLRDLKEAKTVAEGESTITTPEPVKNNKIAITEILSVYSFQRLVDIFGNIPYEQALDINNLAPAYDDGKQIYAKLFARLDAAIAKLDASAASFGTADLIYKGSVAKWKKFAYSLKLKMALAVADVSDLNPGAKATEAVNGGLLASAADNAALNFLSSSANANPIYTNLVESGRNDFVGANTLIDKMNSLSDPRRAQYFNGNIKDANGNVIYKGGIYGSANSYSKFSSVNTKLTAQTWPGIIMDYTEVLFYEAEAIERGFISGTAATKYADAVTSSLTFWGCSSTEIAAYLAAPAVAYATAPGTYKEKIALQAWLAYYDRPDLGWTTWRRLDAPKLNFPAGMTYADVPTRYTYPVVEQTYNPNGYNQGVAGMGGDKLTTKIFWDKN